MKTYPCGPLLLIGLLLGFALPLRSEEAVPGAAAMPTTHEGMVKELIASVESLCVTLEGIKDEAGVQTAKENLTAAMRRQVQLSQAMQKMGDPTPETEAALKEKYEEKMNAATGKLSAHYKRLAEIAAFKTAMMEIQAKLTKELGIQQGPEGQ